MAIEIATIKHDAENVGADLFKLVAGNNTAERIAELAKLLDKVNAEQTEDGNDYLAAIRRYGVECQKADSTLKIVSRITLDNWVEKLNANDGKVPEGLSTSTGAKRGRKAGSVAKSRSISPEDYARLMNAEIELNSIKMSNRVLVTKQDAFVIEELKRRDAQYYNTLALDYIERQKEEIKQRIMQEAQARIDAELSALAAALPTPAPVVSDNPAQLEQPKQEAVFTPAEEKAKPESVADFLDRVKQVICNNEEINGADLDRLHDVAKSGKGENKKLAQSLIDIWNGSQDAPQDDKASN